MTKQIIKFKNKNLSLELRDESDISVMREIFKIKEYKIADQVIINAENPILDVGAHAGFFSIYANTLNSKIDIFAMEPEKNNIQALKKNIELNNIQNINIIQKALYSETGKAKLKKSEDSIFHTISDTGIDIETITLSDLCAQLDIDRFSLIKMDIEGQEYDIFLNMEEDEFNLFNNIILEYHDDNINNHKELETIFRENRFGVQVFKSKFDKKMGFLFANKKV